MVRAIMVCLSKAALHWSTTDRVEHPELENCSIVFHAGCPAPSQRQLVGPDQSVTLNMPLFETTAYLSVFSESQAFGGHWALMCRQVNTNDTIRVSEENFEARMHCAQLPWHSTGQKKAWSGHLGATGVAPRLVRRRPWSDVPASDPARTRRMVTEQTLVQVAAFCLFVALLCLFLLLLTLATGGK
jgi:hypothetical protein